MLSKDEIINELEPNREYPSYYHENDLETAMDQYAQQMSIGFAEWVETNFSFSFGSYSPVDVNNYPYDDLSTEQLYQLYLETVNAK